MRLAVVATAPWSRAREHSVKCGDPVVLRARRHHEGAVLAALDAPGGPAAAFVLDRAERLQFGFDGRVVPEGEAQAVLGFVPAEPEVLAEVDPALALRRKVRVHQRRRDELREV